MSRDTVEDKIIEYLATEEATLIKFLNVELHKNFLGTYSGIKQYKC